MSDETGILSLGVRAYKLSSTHSGSTCSETFAAVMSQSWRLPPSEALPSQGRRAHPHRESALTLAARPHPGLQRSRLCSPLHSASFTGSSPTAEMVPPAPAMPSLERQSPDLHLVGIPPEGLWLAHTVTFCDLEGGVALTSQLTQKI